MDATRKVRHLRGRSRTKKEPSLSRPRPPTHEHQRKNSSSPPPLSLSFSNTLGEKNQNHQTLSEQGVRGMYRGMGAPLATVALFNAVLFSVRGKMERLLAHADGSALTVGDQAVAGAGAGVAVSFLAAPTELIKCRLQSQLTTAQAAGVSTAGVLAPCGTPVFRNVARPGVRPSRFAAAATAAVAAAPSVSPALAGVGGGLHGATGVVVGGATVTSQATRGGPSGNGAGSGGGSSLRGGRPPIAAAAVSTSATSFAPHSAAVSSHLPQNYKGPIDVVKHVWRSEGGPRGLFRGLTPTLMREVPGNAVMFGVYELAKRQLASSQGLESTSQLGTGSMIVAGGLAGTCFWIPVFPADVIKSRWQVDSPAAPGGPQFRSLLDCAAQTVRGGGFKALYRGVGPAMVRAYPANAVCFAAYEAVVRAAGSGSGSE